MKKLMMTCITAAMMLAPLGAYARGVRFVVAPGFGYGYYAPYGYWGAYPYGYYGYGPATGAVKFDTKVKDAEVYVNGAYAGSIGKLKTMNFRPGSYDIEVRQAGQSQFDKKVYVAAGKTLHLNPELRTPSQP